MPNVWMGTPTTRDFSAPYVSSLITTRLDGLLCWRPVIGQDIATGRNAVVQQFLEDIRFEFLLMHDSDATWEAGAVERLAGRGLPVVTGVIFKRGFPTVPTIGKHVSIGANGEHMYNFGGTINRILHRVRDLRSLERNEMTLPETGEDLEEIDGAGCHFMMIHREVLERIPFPWFECVTTNGGEDFDFCRKVQKARYSLHVDYSVFTGHVVGPGVEIGVREFLSHAQHQELNLVWAV